MPSVQTRGYDGGPVPTRVVSRLPTTLVISRAHLGLYRLWSQHRARFSPSSIKGEGGSSLFHRMHGMNAGRQVSPLPFRSQTQEYSVQPGGSEGFLEEMTFS